jgi:hypothetical protein
MMRIWGRWVAASLLALASQSYVTATAIAASPVPTAAQYDRDLQELAAWTQDMNGRQNRLATIVEGMWIGFEDHNKQAEKASDAELRRLFAVLLSKIAETKEGVIAERAGIEAIQPLTRNVVLSELPPGHLGKLRQHGLDTADRLLQLVDRAETQATAMSLGEEELGKEFSLLIMDGSVEMIHSQWAMSQTNQAIAKKGSASAAKMESISQIYEGMEHLIREQRAMAAGQGLGIDLVKIKGIAERMQAVAKSGRTALGKERIELVASRKFLTPNLADTYAAQHENYQLWFDYLTARSDDLAMLPDTLNVDDPYDPSVAEVINRLVAMESKFLELHAAMLARVVS